MAEWWTRIVEPAPEPSGGAKFTVFREIRPGLRCSGEILRQAEVARWY
jgi:hypothetical protein